jgi:hypothetical protein
LRRNGRKKKRKRRSGERKRRKKSGKPLTSGSSPKLLFG